MKLAPDFELVDQHGERHKLSDYKGRWVVLYFYPYDKSLNCRKEACAFRDEYRIVAQFGNAEVIGVNKGTVTSHRQFAERNKLNFPILSDPGHKITEAYGAWRSKASTVFDKAFGTRRNTYLIDPESRIVKSYIGVDPNKHVQEVITDLQTFQDHYKQAAKQQKPEPAAKPVSKR
jgi:peroxiredoxin Q/BCP